MILSAALRGVPRRLVHPWILVLAGGMFVLRLSMPGLHQVRLPGPWLSQLQGWILQFSPRLEAPFGWQHMLDRGCLLLYLFGFSALPWQWTGDRRTMAPLLRGALQAAGLYILLGLPVVALHDHLPAVFRLKPGMVGLGERMAILLMRTGLPVLLGFLLARQEAYRAEKAEAHARMADARWNLLKAQMSPHVLLNSLTGLAELVRVDPGAARRGLEDLVAIHGRLQALGEADLAPLAEERALLEQTLRMERLRLGEALRVDWDWDPALDACPALPLLLQPLVENALKFGPAADPRGGMVTIEGRRENGRLRFRIGNTRSPRPAKTGTGLGLRNLRARLELAYGSAATLVLSHGEDWTYADLDIPREEPA